MRQVIAENMPDLIFQREMICECGEKVKVFKTKIIGGPNKGEDIEIKKGCRCEDIKLAREALEARDRVLKKRRMEIFEKHSLIPPELEMAALDTYKPKTEKQSRALKIAYRYIEVYQKDKPRNLLFTGSFGIGKSHLAKSIADGIIDKGYNAIFISVPKLLRKFRASYQKGSEYNEDDLSNILEEIDLLVLDDIGAESDSQWAKEKLFDVIDSRQGKHTIYTTNYSPEDLYEIMGERNFSRIINRDTTIVEVDGENHRIADVLGRVDS